MICVNGISKQYKRSAVEQYSTVRDKLSNLVKFSFNKNRSKNSFFALNNIFFDVKPGEVVGIIGRNGAGKTTLLKILSRITPPTSGSIELNGRIGSLLEVGTGFHPELTGRENVFFNGAILGMKKQEIKAKFDEIVDFSGVQDFINTPVKRYSGGMRLRLAFAVAAHLDPEILLIDEVLAVGDMGFQEKCIAKVGDVAKQGRTILFVSHNMQAIMALCSRVIVINNGEIYFDGETKEGIEKYTKLNLGDIDTGYFLGDCERKITGGDLSFVSFAYKDEFGQYIKNPILGKSCIIEFTLDAKNDIDKLVRLSCAISDIFGRRITILDTNMTGLKLRDIKKGSFVIDCFIDKIPFMPGTYTLNFFAEINGEISDWIIYGKNMVVSDGDYFNCGEVLHKHSLEIAIDHHWECRQNVLLH